MARVLSIQSQVVYGHVGNSAAVFALERLGHEVLALPTVLYSTHPGHGRFRGRALPAPLLADLVDGLAAAGRLGGIAAVLSGYLGSGPQAEIVRRAVDAVKAANPAVLFVCDPVFGDADKGRYVPPTIVESLRRKLVPIADVATPNAFELEGLTGTPVRCPEDAERAARRLGPPTVLVTSVPFPGERIGNLLVADERTGSWSAPKLDRVPKGAGDLLAALFVGHVLNGTGFDKAVALASGAVDHILKESVRRGADELVLVDEQQCLAAVTP